MPEERQVEVHAEASGDTTPRIKFVNWAGNLAAWPDPDDDQVYVNPEDGRYKAGRLITDVTVTELSQDPHDLDNFHSRCCEAEVYESEEDEPTCASCHETLDDAEMVYQW